MKLTRKTEVFGEKTVPRGKTSSTTNSTWSETGSNPGLRGVRLATNRLSHDTALRQRQHHFQFFIK
jgi:hypothetical protein